METLAAKPYTLKDILRSEDFGVVYLHGISSTALFRRWIRPLGMISYPISRLLSIAPLRLVRIYDGH